MGAYTPGARAKAADGLAATGRSWSNTLISVRQTTQRNEGRKTAGIDGEVALTSQARMEMAVQVHHDGSSWRPRPVKRVRKSGRGRDRLPVSDPDYLVRTRVLTAVIRVLLLGRVS
jgi:hypothetical protein